MCAAAQNAAPLCSRDVARAEHLAAGWPCPLSDAPAHLTEARVLIDDPSVRARPWTTLALRRHLSTPHPGRTAGAPFLNTAVRTFGTALRARMARRRER